MVDTITSHDASSGGNVVNQSVFEFNDAGLLTKEYQEHEGAKDASTLYVQYNRDTSSSGDEYTKGLRPTSIRYPNGRLVHTTYGASDSTADAVNRFDAIKDDSAGSPGNSLAEYSYLGGGTIVKEDFTEPDVYLNYAAGVGDDPDDGFDRFGRIVDQFWYDYGASANRDQITHGYDRSGNRLYRENTISAAKDEFYTYDGVSQLATFDRGDLNAGKTAITGTPVREEDWTLDPTGNWTDYVQKTSGATDLDQDRTQNAINEITSITATTGANWADPVHERAGDMTTVPKPSSPVDGLTATYDPWNRLVEVKTAKRSSASTSTTPKTVGSCVTSTRTGRRAPTASTPTFTTFTTPPGRSRKPESRRSSPRSRRTCSRRINTSGRPATPTVRFSATPTRTRTRCATTNVSTI